MTECNIPSPAATFGAGTTVPPEPSAAPAATLAVSHP